MKPVSSSAYSSSPSLWMYRCYNGQLYRRGQSVTGQKTKIHPNAVVRCELDMDAGTLSFAVNDEEQGVVFDDLSGEIFPAVCFYGSGRAVRLLRVERVGGTGPGVRTYKSNDTHKRKKWEGNFVSGSRHGEGKLYYTSMTGFWYGRWKDDKQHGLHAWIEVDCEKREENERPKIFLFRNDDRVREATEHDFEDALLGIDVMSDEWRTMCKFPTKREAEEGTMDAKPIRNFRDLGLKLLRGMSELSIAATSCVKDIDTNSSTSSQSTNTRENDVNTEMIDDVKNLDEAYAVEPSAEAFSQIHELLRFFVAELETTSHSSETIDMLKQTLNLLRSNFRRLVSSNVDPIEVGIELNSETSSSDDKTLSALLKLLHSLMERKNVRV